MIPKLSPQWACSSGELDKVVLHLLSSHVIMDSSAEPPLGGSVEPPQKRLTRDGRVGSLFWRSRIRRSKSSRSIVDAADDQIKLASAMHHLK